MARFTNSVTDQPNHLDGYSVGDNVAVIRSGKLLEAI